MGGTPRADIHGGAYGIMADEQKALDQQRHRCIELRQELRRIGDTQYDPDAALLRQFSAFFPRFTGHTVAQNSLEYALLLLHSDDRTYGSDDAGEANRIIRRILEHQDFNRSALPLADQSGARLQNRAGIKGPGLAGLELPGEGVQFAPGGLAQTAVDLLLHAVGECPDHQVPAQSIRHRDVKRPLPLFAQLIDGQILERGNFGFEGRHRQSSLTRR